MALRIGGGKQAAAPVEEEQMPMEEMPMEEAPAEEPMPEEAMAEEPAQGGGIVDPMVVNYMGPEFGPFSCGNCQFFGAAGPNTCAVVQGPVEEEGLCNVFSPMAKDEGMEEMPQEEMPEEMPAEEEAPAEEQM